MAENASSTVRPDSTTAGGGGTKVENLLKALNECLEMRGETSANNESAEMNGHHSDNTGQGLVTEQNSLSNGHLENLSEPSRTVTTNGTEKYDDVKDNESVKLDNTPSTTSTTAISETGEEAVGGVKPCQSTTSGAEAANGSEALEEEESATESLLAQKLAVVMEKLEAYKATRDYMLSLANKLKEQNDRYEAEFGNVGGEGGSDSATNNDHGLPAAQSRADDLEVVSNEQLSSTCNEEKDHPINTNSTKTVPSIQSEGKVEQCKETNGAVASNSHPEVESTMSNNEHLNCSNAISNNISLQSEKGPEAHCNDDGGDDDVNADYDDYYYDVSEELEYQYEEDDNNEEQNKNDVPLNLTASDSVVSNAVSKDNKKENVSTDVTEMKNTETVEVAPDAEAAKSINSNTSVSSEAASSKSATNAKQNPTVQENNKFSNDRSSEKQQLDDSTNKTTSTATAEPKDSTSPQPVKATSDGASSASDPSTEAIQSDLASLSKVERLNLMFRLQTEFAKLQLSLVETQEHMRAATAALQRLATLECQDDSV